MVDAVPDDSADMLKTFGIAGPSKAFPRLQDALQYPTLNVAASRARTSVPGARDDHPGPRDRGDGYPAGEGNRVRRPRREAARARAGAGLLTSSTATPPTATARCTSKIASITVSRRPPTRSGRRRSMPQVRSASPTASGAPSAHPPVQLRTLRQAPIAPFIEHSVPGGLVPTVNFDNNQHRGEREPQARAPVSGDRDRGGDTASDLNSDVQPST